MDFMWKSKVKIAEVTNSHFWDNFGSHLRFFDFGSTENCFPANFVFKIFLDHSKATDMIWIKNNLNSNNIELPNWRVWNLHELIYEFEICELKTSILQLLITFIKKYQWLQEILDIFLRRAVWWNEF